MVRSATPAVIAALACSLLMLTCTQLEYNNPIDINGSNAQWLKEHPEALIDANKNGIIDYWEMVPPEDTTRPVVTIIDGDTVTLKYEDPNHILEALMTKFTYKDAGGGEHTVLPVEHNVNPYRPNDETGIAYWMKYTVMDAAGNRGSATRYVWVTEFKIDTVKPIIYIPLTQIPLFAGDIFTDDGVTAFDHVDGDLTFRIVPSGLVDMSTPGTYIRTYTVTDNSDNTATSACTVTVKPVKKIDRDIPVITLQGADTIPFPSGVDSAGFFAAFVEPGYSAYDTTEGVITEKVKVSKPFRFSDAYYYITYDVSDSSENRAEQKKRVFPTGVTPDMKPWIDLVDADSIHSVVIGGIWVEPGYSAGDIVDGEITRLVVVDTSDLINHITTKGSYIISYTVVNSRGASAREVRQVLVIESQYDTIPPEIKLLGRNPDTVQVGSAATYTDPDWEAYDNHDGDLHDSVHVNGTVDMNTVGTYKLNYSVADKTTRIGRATRTVCVVLDTTAGNIFAMYGVPAETALPSVSNKKYTGHTIDGSGGPDLSGVEYLSFNWNSANNQIDISMQLGVSPYYLPLGNNATHTLGSAGPTITLSGTGITGLNGTYYVTVKGTQFIWVAKSGDFAIIWKQ